MFISVILLYVFFFFKQKTAYEMRISDWSSDVCSSDLGGADRHAQQFFVAAGVVLHPEHADRATLDHRARDHRRSRDDQRVQGIAIVAERMRDKAVIGGVAHRRVQKADDAQRSEEHTSELQLLMHISYAVFCLQKKSHKPTLQ